MKKTLAVLTIIGVAALLIMAIAVRRRSQADLPIREERKEQTPPESEKATDGVKPVRPASAAPTAYLLAEKDPPTQADPELTKRLIDTLSVDNPAETVAILLDIKKDATSRNEAANLLRRSGYGGLTDDLIKSLGSPEEGPLWRDYCIQHLWTNAKSASDVEQVKIMGALRGAITDRHTRVRREAVLALCRLHEPMGQGTAIKWLTAQEGEGARDVAIRCMEDLNLRDQAPAIRKLATDPDESTAVQAIGTLGRWKDEASRPLFEEALKSHNQRVQKAARAALRHLVEAKDQAGGAETKGE